MFLRRRQRRRRGLGQAGVATVEFALCLIPLLLIVAGVVDYGESWYIQSVLATASREGARYATRYQTNSTTGQRLIPNALPTSIKDYVLNKPEENSCNCGYGLKYILPSNANPNVLPGGSGLTTGTQGAPVSVKVTANKYWLFLNRVMPGLTNPQPLASSTTMACE